MMGYLSMVEISYHAFLLISALSVPMGILFGVLPCYPFGSMQYSEGAYLG